MVLKEAVLWKSVSTEDLRTSATLLLDEVLVLMGTLVLLIVPITLSGLS